MLEKLKTRLVVTRKNMYAKVPLTSMLMAFVIADKIKFESEVLTAVKWALFGAIITILMAVYSVLAITEKEIDIFDTKLLEKKEENADTPTKDSKPPFTAASHFLN